MYGATLQLAKKCVKTLVRQRSVVLLVALSTFVVYGSLMVAWWLSRNNFRTIMSSVIQMTLEILILSLGLIFIFSVLYSIHTHQ